MKEDGTDTGKEKGDLYGETFAVKEAIHQNGDEDSSAKHGEHMLKTKEKNLEKSKMGGVINSSFRCLY